MKEKEMKEKERIERVFEENEKISYESTTRRKHTGKEKYICISRQIFEATKVLILDDAEVPLSINGKNSTSLVMKNGR